MAKVAEKIRWPAWCLGPGGESVLVQSANELPKGFYHPRLAKPSAPIVEPAGLAGGGDLSADRTVPVEKKRGRPRKPALDL